MIDFVKMLIFAKTVVLTPDLVTINRETGPYEIFLDDPISAITSGASIRIDVIEMFGYGPDATISKIRTKVVRQIPDGSVFATLRGEDRSVLLQFKGGEK